MKIIRRLFLLSTTAFFIGALIDLPTMVVIFAFITFVLGAALLGLDTDNRGDKNDG